MTTKQLLQAWEESILESGQSLFGSNLRPTEGLFDVSNISDRFYETFEEKTGIPTEKLVGWFIDWAKETDTFGSPSPSLMRSSDFMEYVSDRLMLIVAASSVPTEDQ